MEVRLSRVFRNSMQPDAKVGEMGDWSGDTWTWNFLLRRQWFHWENQVVQQLMDQLQMVHIRREGVDTWIWRHHNSGMFSVKSAYASLLDSVTNFSSEAFNLLWKIPVPQNATHLAWKILHNRIATKVNLNIRRVPVGDIMCCLCNGEPESTEHLFFHCQIANKVWKECYRWVNITTVLPYQPHEHFLQHRMPGVGANGSKGWLAVWIAVLLSIWYHRNAVMFNNGVVDVEEIQVLAKVRAWSWINAKSNKNNLHILIGLTIQKYVSTTLMELDCK